MDKYKSYCLQLSIGSSFSCVFGLLVLLNVYFQNLIGLFFSMFFEGFFTRIAYLSIIDSLKQHIRIYLVINKQVTYHSGEFGGLGVVCAMMFLVAITSNVFKANTTQLAAENRIELDESDPNTRCF